MGLVQPTTGGSEGGGELGKGEAGAGCGQEAGEEGSEERNVPPQLGGDRYLVGEGVCWLWGP